jgi:hypothetical protein
MMSPQEENAKVKVDLPVLAGRIKLLVCGGRDYTDKSFLWSWLDCFEKTNVITHVITGGATGADALASAWASERGIQQVIVPANWRVHGNSAGPKRNRAMAELKPSLVVAFPGGKGTASMLAIARELNLNVLEIAPL